MGIFALANFTAADGTALTSYTPDTGTLTKHAAYSGSGTPVISSNRARAATSLEIELWRFGTSPDADQPVTAVVRKVTGQGILDVFARLDSSAYTGYFARWYNGSYYLYRVNAGSFTQLGSSVASAWSDGTSREFHLHPTTNGSQVDLSFEVDGVVVATYSDTSASRITAAGSVGFGFYETETPGVSAGFHLDSIQGGFADDITIDEPVQYQVIQRGSSGRGDIVISGTYGGSPTAIEASWNGGAYQTIDASPSGGTYSGTLTGQLKGQGTLTVRYTNDTGISATVANVGVGEVFAIAGQSNAVGLGTSNQSYSGSFTATTFANDYTWKVLADPTDSPTGQVDSVSDDTGIAAGSYWPHMVTDLMAELECPIAIVPCAKGSTAITDWTPGVNHFNRATLYGSLAYRIQQVGAVRAVLWHQGEADAFSAMSQATYNGHLDTIANALRTDVDCPLVACLLQNSTGLTNTDEQKIRDAVSEAAADNANVYLGPDLSDLSSDDDYHLKQTAKLETAGQRWAAALLASDLFTSSVGGLGFGIGTGIIGG